MFLCGITYSNEVINAAWGSIGDLYNHYSGIILPFLLLIPKLYFIEYIYFHYITKFYLVSKYLLLKDYICYLLKEETENFNGQNGSLCKSRATNPHSLFAKVFRVYTS